MKILFVINSLNMGGAEKLLVESIPFFQKQNIDVDVVLLTKGKSKNLLWDLENKCKGKIYSLTSKSIYNPFLIFDLVRIFRRYSHAHIHLFPALYWCVFAKIFSRSKIRLFYTEHSTYNKRRNNVFFRLVDKYVYSYLEKIIAISIDVRKNLIEHIGSRFNDKIVVVLNGIDIDKFSNAQAYPKSHFFSDDSIILTQVSSFRYPKDQKTILKSLVLLDNKIKLLLIGDGKLLEECKQFAENIGVADRVLFLGIRNDIPQILKLSDILILSSAYEGLSLSIIEGMSARKPFVASDVPGITEVVKGYGLVFKYQDEIMLADIVKSLLSDNIYYRDIADKCYQRSNDFNINNMVLSYIDVYGAA